MNKSPFVFLLRDIKTISYNNADIFFRDKSDSRVLSINEMRGQKGKKRKRKTKRKEKVKRRRRKKKDFPYTFE